MVRKKDGGSHTTNDCTNISRRPQELEWFAFNAASNSDKRLRHGSTLCACALQQRRHLSCALKCLNS